MNIEIIDSEKTPKAIGPYSQGIIANGFLFVSGQIPLNPETNELIFGKIDAQTEQVLNNLDAVLEAAGTSWDKVVRTTVFLTDLSNFNLFNTVYAEHLKGAEPTRTTVQVNSLPRNCLIEMDLIAVCDQ